MTSPSKILRFDIETAPLFSSEEEVPEDVMMVRKSKYCTKKPEKTSYFDFYFEKSPLIAEFSKVICISLGYSSQDFREVKLNTTSIVGEETDILEQFRGFLEKFPSDKRTLGGHNIKGFDIPYLSKRFIINGLTIPPFLVTTGVKPRELNFVDTMDLRKMGGFASTGLETICIALGIPSCKELMDGSMVGKAFYEGRMQDIVSYCEKDVESVYRVWCKLNNKSDHISGADKITEVSEEFIGVRCWKYLTGIKDLSKMSKSQNLRFNRFIEQYHADNDKCKAN